MLRAVLGSVAVLVIPGAVIAYAMRASLRRLATWAVIPAFSLAAVFVVGEISAPAPWPFNAWTVAVFTLLGAVAGVAWRQSIGDRKPMTAPILGGSLDSSSEYGSSWTARVLLALAMAAGLAILAHAIGGHDLVPPEVDASNHGFFVARVIESGSLDLRQVVVSDVGATHRVASFYPLGMHASAAVASELTRADIGQVLLAFDVIFAAIVFPLGMFVLARMIVPDKPLAAGFTALVAIALSLFPYGAIPYGDVPLVVGMALVPISVLVITRALTLPSTVSPRRSLGTLAAAALVALTAISVHSSQVPLIAVLVVLSVLDIAWRRSSMRVLTDALTRACICGAMALVLFAPNVAHFFSGVSERSSVTLTFPVSLGRAVREIFLPQVRTPGFRQALLTLLIAAGGVILLLRRQRAWVVGYALVLAVTLLVWVSNGPLSKLIGAPWYHSSVRLNFNQIFFAALFAGVALAYAVDALTRFRPLNAAVASSLIVVVFVATVGWSEYRNTTKSLRRSFTVDARVTDSSLAAFDWLDAHANPNDVIVNDQNADGSLWMYAFKRLRPLFAIKPIFSDAAAVADWSDRMYVANHIAEIGDNSRADLLVRRFDAKWVYFDEQVFDLFGHRMHLDALRANKNLQLVFHQGTVYVFRIGDLARTTPSAG